MHAQEKSGSPSDPSACKPSGACSAAATSRAAAISLTSPVGSFLASRATWLSMLKNMLCSTKNTQFCKMCIQALALGPVHAAARQRHSTAADDRHPGDTVRACLA